METQPREMLITHHKRPEWDSARLLQMIRAAHAKTFGLRIAAPVILLLLTVFCKSVRVLFLILLAGYAVLFGRRLLYDLQMMLMPEKCGLFRKYGTPDAVAEMLNGTGGQMRVFDNGQTLLNAELLVNRDSPESLLLLPDARLAYSQRQVLLFQGARETLTVHDRWGDCFRYPVSGKGQFFRANVLLDRLAQQPDCRIGNTPQNHRYAKDKKEPLPAAPSQED